MNKTLVLLVVLFHLLTNLSNAELVSSMKFSLHYACEGKGPSCPYYVLAEGIIEADTPKKFLNFMREVKEGRGGHPTVYFNSPGGVRLF